MYSQQDIETLILEADEQLKALEHVVDDPHVARTLVLLTSQFEQGLGYLQDWLAAVRTDTETPQIAAQLEIGMRMLKAIKSHQTPSSLQALKSVRTN